MSAADLITSAPSREPARHSLTTRIVIYGLLALFASHPPLEERIARLENPTLG